MSVERLPQGEVQNRAQEQEFFTRRVDLTATRLSEKVLLSKDSTPATVEGQAKMLVVNNKVYKITLVEPYFTENANPAWEKKIETIAAMDPGTVFCYHHRVGVLTFIKAGTQADNILIRALQELETGKKTKNSTEVTRILGLKSGETGKLSFTEQKTLKFEPQPHSA